MKKILTPLVLVLVLFVSFLILERVNAQDESVTFTLPENTLQLFLQQFQNLPGFKITEEKAKELEKLLVMPTGKMNEDIWLDIMSQLSCFAQINQKVDDAKFAKIVEPYGVTGEEWLAYYWQMMTGKREINLEKFEEAQKKYEAKIEELKKTNCQPTVTPQNGIKTGQMTDEIWLEITARIKCLDRTLLSFTKYEIKTIFDPFGVTPTEYQTYAQDVVKRMEEASKKSNQVTTCTDSDGGKDYFTKGVVRGKNPVSGAWEDYSDYCLGGEDAGKVAEYYCSPYGDEGGVRIDYQCPNGCQDGACLKCMDSDGGKDYFVKGTARGKNPLTGAWEDYSDYCLSDEKEGYVAEYYCSPYGDEGAIRIDYNCPNGCQDGACLTCTDSDGGKDYFTKGVVRGKNPVSGAWEDYSDYCLSDEKEGYIAEQYCSPYGDEGTIRIDYQCPNGCQNGACLKENVKALTKLGRRLKQRIEELKKKNCVLEDGTPISEDYNKPIEKPGWWDEKKCGIFSCDNCYKVTDSSSFWEKYRCKSLCEGCPTSTPPTPQVDNCSGFCSMENCPDYAATTSGSCAPREKCKKCGPFKLFKCCSPAPAVCCKAKPIEFCALKNCPLGTAPSCAKNCPSGKEKYTCWVIFKCSRQVKGVCCVSQ